MMAQLYVFGSNGASQLGIPTADAVSVPTPATLPTSLSPTSIKSIKSGDNHTLLLLTDGTAYGSGSNAKGQLLPALGHPSLISTFTNTHDRISFVAATLESSAYIIADKDAGQSWVYTEGTAAWGELGRGEGISNMSAFDTERAPFLGPFPGTIVDMAGGAWHYVVLLEDGNLYGWGKARLGQLGKGLEGRVSTPTKVEGVEFKPVRVVAGKEFTYLVGEPGSGEHVVLGEDKFGLVSGAPKDVKGWKDIGATWNAVFVLFENGRLTAWGKENNWQLIPADLPPIDKIAVGSDHVLALTKDGKLISWGWGKHGNVGDLSKITQEFKNETVSGFWNEIELPGQIEVIGAGACTSFVVTK